MKIEETKLENLIKIIPDVYEDHRGYYIETYNKEEYYSSGIKVDFIQDDISVSHKNVLRGIHGDKETWKLISCLEGEFYLVVVNNDANSSQYKQSDAFYLSDKNRVQILVPPNFGNGHLVLSERAVFHYKQSTYYNVKGQFSILWNDPKFNIFWPTKHPILSKRDTIGKI